MKVTVSRKAHFNAAHRLYRKDWSDEKNQTIFGKCSNLHFNGQNNELVVNVTGIINPDTGYVIDMKILKDLIKEEVEEKMDHKNLNEEVPEFYDKIPTAENIVIVIYEALKPHMNPEHELAVTLYETPRNFVSYSG